MKTYIDKSNGITEGLRKSFQSTDCKMANRQCYGYDISPNGDLVVNHGGHPFCLCAQNNMP